MPRALPGTQGPCAASPDRGGRRARPSARGPGEAHPSRRACRPSRSRSSSPPAATQSRMLATVSARRTAALGANRIAVMADPGPRGRPPKAPDTAGQAPARAGSSQSHRPDSAPRRRPPRIARRSVARRARRPGRSAQHRPGARRQGRRRSVFSASHPSRSASLGAYIGNQRSPPLAITSAQLTASSASERRPRPHGKCGYSIRGKTGFPFPADRAYETHAPCHHAGCPTNRRQGSIPTRSSDCAMHAMFWP